MPYTPTDILQARIESLRAGRPRTSYASGLADGIRSFRAGRLEKDLEKKQAENEQIKTQEMQMLINALSGAQAPMQPGAMPNFQHPEIQQLALAQALKKAQQGAPELMTVAEGAAVLDPVTRQPVFTNRRPESPIRGNPGDVFLDPETYRQVAAIPERVNYNQPFLPDGTPNQAYQQYEKDRTAAGATNVTTNVTPKAESAYLASRAGSQASAMGELEKSAQSAYEANSALDRFLAESGEGYSGGAQPLLTGVSNFLASFGFESDKLTSTGLMQQAIGNILGSKMSELGARGLTDKDMEVLRESLPRVNTSREAREAVAGVLKASNQRVIDEYVRRARKEQEQYPDYQFQRPGWFEGAANPAPPSSEDIVAEAMRIIQGGR